MVMPINILNKLYIQILFAVTTALLLIMSTAGFGVSFTVFFAFIPLFLALSVEKNHPVLLGFITGFLYFSICLSWMMITFGYFGGAPLIAALALLIFISSLGALFFIVPFTYVFARFSKNPCIISLLFILLEAVKGKVFFGGVPWLNLAQSQYKNTLILQSVSVFGEYGLSFLIMVINVLLFYLITDFKTKKNIILPFAVILIMLLPGIYRAVNPIEYSEYKKIAVIQTGYNQEDKWDNDKWLNISNNINIQIMDAYNKNVDMIVLPESSYPVNILKTEFLINFLNKVSEKTPIIFGATRRIMVDNESKLFNTMVLLDNNTQTYYDKRHLTPFGEYFPFENLLRPVKEFFFGKGSMFSPGDNAAILTSGNIKAAPVICFESAFSTLVNDSVALGANLLVIISNDTWFGKNQGRMQHLAVDTIRAVEYGRAVARATQDGISAFILPNGEIPLMEEGQMPAVLIYDVPLSEYNTFFAKYSNIWIAFIIPLLYYRLRADRLRKKEKNGK